MPHTLQIQGVVGYGKLTGLCADVFSMFFGRTDLRTSVSRAKFDAESDFEVRLAVAPQKPCQNVENRSFRSKNFAEEKFPRRKKHWTKFRIEKSVFRVVFKELRPNGPQNQLPSEILL